MDYDAYRNKYFVEPAPDPRYLFTGTFGITLYFLEYDAAIDYYQKVLGPAAYVEGLNTRGWPVGAGWLTLLRSNSGNPQNAELMFEMKSPAEAEDLQRAFIEAGGTGGAPSDQLMYRPIRACPVRDPFGTEILIFSLLND